MVSSFSRGGHDRADLVIGGHDLIPIIIYDV